MASTLPRSPSGFEKLPAELYDEVCLSFAWYFTNANTSRYSLIYQSPWKLIISIPTQSRIESRMITRCTPLIISEGFGAPSRAIFDRTI